MDTLLFHPKVVHLPMAIAVLMPLIAGGLLLAWWRSWLPHRGWFVAIGLQAILLGSGIVALRTGEAEPKPTRVRIRHLTNRCTELIRNTRLSHL